MEKTGKKKNIAIIVVLTAGVLIACLGIFLLWYINADPAVKPGDYKNMKVICAETATGSNSALGGLEISVSQNEREKQAVLKQLVDEAEFYRIRGMVNDRYEEFLAYYRRLAMLYDEYKTIEKLATDYYNYESYEAFCKDVKLYAETSVKQELILSEIAQKEGFSVTDEIFNTYIGNYLAEYDYGNSRDEIEKFLEVYGKENVYEVILNDYTLDRICEWSEIIE